MSKKESDFAPHFHFPKTVRQPGENKENNKAMVMIDQSVLLRNFQQVRFRKDRKDSWRNQEGLAFLKKRKKERKKEREKERKKRKTKKRRLYIW